MTISIITPWRNHPELIPAYEAAVVGAQVIVVDNASQIGPARQIASMVERLGGVYIRNEDNLWFTTANNQGLEAATGDVILFLNNDIQAEPGWLRLVAADCEPGVLTGPSLGIRLVGGEWLTYVEGWCIGAHRLVWEALGGWDAQTFYYPYWEDNDLAFRASLLGIGCRRGRWPVAHLSNTTSAHTAGAYDHSAANEAAFRERVRKVREGMLLSEWNDLLHPRRDSHAPEEQGPDAFSVREASPNGTGVGAQDALHQEVAGARQEAPV